MGMLDREYNEKRDFIRMKINTPVQVTPIDGTEVFIGVCRDLSGGGMLLSIDQDLPLGVELMVKLMSDHGHGPVLQARCLIGRSDPGPSNSKLLGLEIMEVMNKSGSTPEAIS